jgi:ribosomal subunit interface protein
MDVQITSRHFKARDTLLDHVRGSLEDLQQIYEGIINAEVILEVEPHNEGKIAEIILMVYHDRLFAKEMSDDFEMSVSSCVSKLERQLRKYKEKLQRGQRPGAGVEPSAVITDTENE